MQKHSFAAVFFLSSFVIQACLMIPHAHAAAVTPSLPPLRIDLQSPSSTTLSPETAIRRRRLTTDRPSRRNILSLGDPGSLLGTLRFSGINAPMTIESIAIMIDALPANGTEFDPDSDDVRTMVSNVKLINTRTKSSVQGRLLSEPEDAAVTPERAYQIYTFRGVMLDRGDALELRMRTNKRGADRHPVAGDLFRMIACTETGQGCLFSGILNERFDRHKLEAEVFWRGMR